MAMMKRMRQRRIGLVSRAMLFIQDRAEVLSANILKTWPPDGAITIVAHARARTTLTMARMSSNGLMWSPYHPGSGSYSLLVKTFM
jgi:hypothetical protein